MPIEGNNYTRQPAKESSSQMDVQLNFATILSHSKCIQISTLILYNENVRVPDEKLKSCKFD